MRNLVLDIIVIEICSAAGCPLNMQVNIAISNQSALSSVILVFFLLYHCFSAISS
jgi:hypothetical protein